MSVRIVITTLIVLLTVAKAPCYSLQNKITDPSAIKDRIDQIMDDALHEQNLPGIGVAINIDGEHFYNNGYGYANVFKHMPVTPHTRFGLGSCSKAFTAFAVMMLVEEGKINLKASIRKYLSGPPPSWEPVTIEMLLSHTSGIPKFEGPHVPWTKTWNEVAKRPFAFAPGSNTQYSNFGFSVLSRLVEVVSKMDYADFMEKRIFKPLMMRSTGIPEDEYPRDLATGYKTTPKGIELNTRHKPWTQMWGSGGIVSTLSDFAKWDRAMTQGALLNAKTYKRMWTPVLLNNGDRSGWCLGWQISKPNKPLAYSKDGGITGYRSYIVRYIDEGISVILLSNTTPVKIAKLAKAIKEAIVSGTN